MPELYATPPVFSNTGALLTGLVVTVLYVGIVRGPVVYRQLRRAAEQPDADPRVVLRFYRRGVLVWWLLVGLSLAAFVLSPKLSAAHLGLRLPVGWNAVVGYGLVVYFLAVVIVGRLRLARRIRRGAPVKLLRADFALLPKTPAGRKLGIAVALTAGIAEELVFRGLLIAAGVGILGLSVWVSAALTVVLFAAGHLYQGWVAIGPALAGVVLTMMYLLTGSLLPGMLVHIAIDVLALVVPVRRDPARAAPAPPETVREVPPPTPAPPQPAAPFALRPAAPPPAE